MHADFLNSDSEGLSLVIRDQKTTRTIGFHKCDIPQLLQDLIRLWLDFVRAIMVQDGTITHESVLWNLSNGMPFTQQAFSKFSAKAFKKVAGVEVNLQTIRRIFASGVYLCIFE